MNMEKDKHWLSLMFYLLLPPCRLVGILCSFLGKSVSENVFFALNFKCYENETELKHQIGTLKPCQK